MSERVTSVPETYLAKVRRGERPTPEDGLDFLCAWHAAHPAATAQSVSERRFADGQSSYELLASCVPAGADASVVDLACGDGLLTSLLAGRLGEGARILGVDASEDDLALARARGCPPRVRFSCELASAMSPATASVDAVLCHWALMLFVPLDPVVAEIARVLAPGGTFAAVVPSMWSIGTVSPELQALVTRVRAADLPGFPDLGLVEPRFATEGRARSSAATPGSRCRWRSRRTRRRPGGTGRPSWGRFIMRTGSTCCARRAARGCWRRRSGSWQACRSRWRCRPR